MKVVHVETGRHLYGGGQQVLWLIDGLNRNGIHNVLVCASDSALAVAADDAGINVVNLSCRGDLDVAFVRRLRAVLREQKPDLVHCHSRRGADFLGGRAARANGIPAVVSRRVDNREPGWLAGLRYRPYQKIVAISEAIAEVLRGAGITDNRLTVIRSAVDASYYDEPADDAAFRQEFDLRSGDPVLFCVAQLIERKGHRCLLKAMSKLLPRYPRLQLILFGKGPLEAELRSLAGSLGLANAVQFAGFREDLDDYLACADLLVHPALAEGLGVAALKAAAAGVPVVAFAAGGLREAVVHNETGLLLPTGDVAALAAGITELLDDSERRRQFGTNGRARMQKEFSIEAMVASHIDLYRSILND
ncbi:MAG: glycosyltransferase family 4 protein [Woeseia sp.]